MSLNYVVGVKNARLDAVSSKIDAGASAGKIEIGTASMAVVLSTIVLANPVAAAAASGTLTFSGFPRSDPSASASGVAASARIVDGDGNEVITGLTVGLTGSDINLDNTNINVGQQITLNTAVINHAP